MKKRPSFASVYMQLAIGLSERSTCARSQVGCVITSYDYTKVLAVGYNGNIPHGINDCDRHGEEAVGNCGCLHAEENAIINCDISRDTPKIVICTHSPCVMCAKRIIRLGGVTRLIYLTEYRNSDAFALLKFAGIPTGKLEIA